MRPGGQVGSGKPDVRDHDQLGLRSDRKPIHVRGADAIVTITGVPVTLVLHSARKILSSGESFG